jgi:ABC-type xylose transport system substrate-binding protein
VEAKDRVIDAEQVDSTESSGTEVERSGSDNDACMFFNGDNNVVDPLVDPSVRPRSPRVTLSLVD